MKKIKFLVASLLLGGITYGQAPTGTPPPNLPSPQLGQYAWYRGGNFAVGAAGNNNIFGTMAGFNSPIYTHTNGINRMIVNGDRAVTLNGYAANNTSGYVGIGPNSTGVTGGNVPLWTNAGPYSLLHLNGRDGGGQAFGYRPWMQTGITFTEEFDLSYVGNRVIGTNHDINEFTLAWSNDPLNPPLLVRV